MALQTLTSSTLAPVETGTSNSGSNTDPNTPGRNSIPFSFLVAFLALFVAFMTIGLCARRIVYFVRLQLGLPIPQPQERPHAMKAKKPILWDVYPERRDEGGRWQDIEVSPLHSARPPPLLTSYSISRIAVVWVVCTPSGTFINGSRQRRPHLPRVSLDSRPSRLYSSNTRGWRHEDRSSSAPPASPPLSPNSDQPSTSHTQLQAVLEGHFPSDHTS